MRDLASHQAAFGLAYDPLVTAVAERPVVPSQKQETYNALERLALQEQIDDWRTARFAGNAAHDGWVRLTQHLPHGEIPPELPVAQELARQAAADSLPDDLQLTLLLWRKPGLNLTYPELYVVQGDRAPLLAHLRQAAPHAELVLSQTWRGTATARRSRRHQEEQRS